MIVSAWLYLFWPLLSAVSSTYTKPASQFRAGAVLAMWVLLSCLFDQIQSMLSVATSGIKNSLIMAAAMSSAPKLDVAY